MFKEFMKLRRKWFLILFATTFPAGIWYSGQQSESMITILPVALVGSLVLTTIISILSIPVVAIIVKKKAKDQGD